jgi:hypothetical protein
MKKIYICLALLVFATSFSFSQLISDLENQDNSLPTILKSQENTILGLFNPENFSMHHNYTMSYSSFGGNGIALGVYTNSMSYKFSDKLNVKTDISLIHSPFSTYSKGVTDKLSGIYLSNAEVNYKPYDNIIIQLRYNKSPYSYYDPFSNYSRYGYFNDPFSGYSR